MMQEQNKLLKHSGEMLPWEIKLPTEFLTNEGIFSLPS